MKANTLVSRVRSLLVILTISIISMSCGKDPSTGPNGTEEVNGTLSVIEGIPVLRLWGTPREQGYAHGYLIGEDIATMLDDFIESAMGGLDADAWENELIPATGAFQLEQRFVEELEGMLAGVEAGTVGAHAYIPSLGRNLTYDDLAAINIGPDFFSIGCTTFAAWDSMTSDGATIAGRNFDWPEIPGVFEKQIIVVSVPATGSGRMGYVSINWPGIIGCYTAMNAEGVTLSTHDTNGHSPTATTGFSPRLLIYREAIESAHAGTAQEDVEAVFRARMTTTPQNMMLTFPSSAGNTGSVVFEYDGDLSVTGGVSVREPDGIESFQICTNHCRERVLPTECWRYSLLEGQLESIAASGGANHLTSEMVWALLDSIALGNSTHHRVVFEPDELLMHFAFSVDVPAPACTFITLNVTELLAGTGF